MPFVWGDLGGVRRCIVIFGYRWAVASATEIAVTDHRLIYKRGIFSINSDELEIGAIEVIHLHQSLLGRLLGFGELTIHGRGEDQIRLPSIANVVAFRREIEGAAHH